MSISDRLYNLRKDKKISQEELANVLGVSRQTVSKWETGESTPDFDKIIPLCNYFGITSDELLSGKKDIVESNKNENKKAFARNLAISVALYISSVIMIIFFATTIDQPELGVCLFFLINAIATGLIIYNGVVYGKKVEKQKKKENTTIKLICEIIDIVGIVVYFLVSFTTGAWHITWIIFLIIALCQTIAKLIYGIKNGEKEEGEDENE